MPVFLPQRIDDELCEMLAKYHPLWINLHFNHPNEITPEVSRAVDKLTRAGLPVGNQSVLLAGVNDCVHIQRNLVHKLVANRIRPYYLYQCDLVEGSGHFRTPVGKGLEIMEGLRGHTSGYAVPTYVIDAPGGGGKIPVMPNYLISYSDHKVVLRNYEGYITTYEEPETYQKHDSSRCRTASTSAPSPASPASSACSRASGCGSSRKGFEETHTRGNTEAHRLQDPSKWVPFGVGAIEGTAGAPLRVLEPARSRRRPRRDRAPTTARARSRGRARASRRRRPTGSCSSDPAGRGRPGRDGSTASIDPGARGSASGGRSARRWAGSSSASTTRSSARRSRRPSWSSRRKPHRAGAPPPTAATSRSSCRTSRRGRPDRRRPTATPRRSTPPG